jgi:hypothetical protein
MIAIWPAGPPKLMKPSLSQNQNAWARLIDAGGASGDGDGAGAAVSVVVLVMALVVCRR